jgi:hypothetical protein
MKEVRLDSAAELMQLADALVDEHAPGALLFRGQNDADMPLLPSAFRVGRSCPFRDEPKTIAELIRKEVEALVRFFEAAHYEGLRIPGEFDLVRATLRRFDVRGGPIPERWMAGPVEALMAIAQHHGTPTRMLDWTTDFFVAAYFACARWDRGADEGTDMAIFVLDCSRVSPRTNRPIQVNLHPVVIPYDLNQNARAQRGTFIEFHQNRHPTEGEIVRIPLDRYLEDHFQIPEAVLRIRVPRSEATRLLRRLESRRITGGSLFPGYGGAARAEREQGLT